MNKIKICLLLLLVVAGCFVLVGCGSKVDITDSLYEENIQESFTTRGHVWSITYYVDEGDLDLDVVDKIEIKINGEKLSPSYIDRENNCFKVEYVDPEYNAVNVYVDKCLAYVSGEREADDGEVHDSDNDSISVGETILFGAIVTLIAIFIYWQAIIAESAMGLTVANVVTTVVAFLAFISYFSFGIWQGVVMTVYAAIYVGVTEGILKNHYDL